MNTTDIPNMLHGVIQEVRARHPERPALIGVGGAQGSGKTTVCQQLAAANRPRFAHFSLDDVYLTHADRARLAGDRHPLFATRGPPGTHDLDLAAQTIDALRRAQAQTATPLPRFDKARDDRAPASTWPVHVGRPEAILIDGWCMGAAAHAGPAAPLNALEAQADREGRWRAAVQAALAGRYQSFFAGFDAMLYLQAPSWEIVRRWRGQQEAQLLARPLSADENEALDRFVLHYERVTRAMLAGHHGARWIVHLDDARNVVKVEER